MYMVCVKVPATTANLGPGFDCLGMALKLYNTVEMEEIGNGLCIEVEGDGKSGIPTDEENIVYKAALKVFKAVGYVPKGLKIKLKNDIPLCRGLGSSAAAIVGGIVAANVLSGKKLDKYKMLKLANQMEGHPDNVAPALLGGIIISTVIKNNIEYIKIKPPAGLKAVVAVPDFQLSTKLAREVLPKGVPFEDAVFNVSRVSLLIACLYSGDLSKIKFAVEDRLHQNYRAKLVPGMEEVFREAYNAGARGVVLSGAGPTLLALAGDNFDAIADAMCKTFKKYGIKTSIMQLEPSDGGAITV